MPILNNSEIDPAIINLHPICPDLKKDIIDTAVQIKKRPFVREEAIVRITINDKKYPNWLTASCPTTANSIKPLEELQDSDLQFNLKIQLCHMLSLASMKTQQINTDGRNGLRK